MVTESTSRVPSEVRQRIAGEGGLASETLSETALRVKEALEAKQNAEQQLGSALAEMIASIQRRDEGMQSYIDAHTAAVVKARAAQAAYGRVVMEHSGELQAEWAREIEAAVMNVFEQSMGQYEKFFTDAGVEVVDPFPVTITITGYEKVSITSGKKKREGGTDNDLRNAIADILASEGPLHRRVVHDRLVEMGVHIGGRDPVNNVGAHLSIDPRFRNVGSGIWDLNEPRPPDAKDQPEQLDANSISGDTSDGFSANHDPDDSDEEDNVPW